MVWIVVYTNFDYKYEEHKQAYIKAFSNEEKANEWIESTYIYKTGRKTSCVYNIINTIYVISSKNLEVDSDDKMNGIFT